MMTKTQTVLSIPEGWSKGVNRGQVFFGQEGTDEDTRQHEMYLDRQVWEELGSPTTVTITIEPGDKLNDQGNVEAERILKEVHDNG